MMRSCRLVPGAILKLVILVLLAVATSCDWDFEQLPPGDVNKQLDDTVKNWFERACKVCDQLTGDARAICLSDKGRRNDELTAKILEAYNAYIECRENDWKTARKGLEDLLKAGIGQIPKLIGGMMSKNASQVVGAHTEIRIDKNALKTGGTYNLSTSGILEASRYKHVPLTINLGGSFVATLPTTGSHREGTVQSLLWSAQLGTESATLTLAQDLLVPGNYVSLDFDEGAGLYRGLMVVFVEVSNDLLGNPTWVLSIPVETIDPNMELNMRTPGFISANVVFPYESPEHGIPAASEWGLVVTALLIASAATVVLMRRRAMVARSS